MAGFAAALKGLMGLSDSSYKAQEEFLNRDWFNRQNLQREQMGNVNMEATRANMQAQAANLELQRQQEARLAAQNRIAQSRQALQDQYTAQDRALQEGERYGVGGLPTLAAVAPSTVAPVAPAAMTNGAPVVATPSQAPVVAPQAPPAVIGQVAMPSRGASGPASPVQNLGQIPPTPAPTAVAPAQQAPQPTATATGRVIPPLPSTTVSRVPVVPSYNVTDDLANRRVIGAERARMQDWEAEYNQLRQNGTPGMISSLLARIDRESNGWASQFGGMRQPFKEQAEALVGNLQELHSVASERIIRDDEDRAQITRQREDQIANLERGYRDRPLTVMEQRTYKMPAGTMLSQVEGMTPEEAPSDRTRFLQGLTGTLLPQLENIAPNNFEAQADAAQRMVRQILANGDIDQTEAGILQDQLLKRIEAARARALSEGLRIDAAGRAEASTGGGTGGTGRTGGYNMAPAPATEDVIAVMRQNNIAPRSVVNNQKPANINTANWNNLRSRYISWWQAMNGRSGNPPGWKESGRSTRETDEAAILEAAGALD